jgi:hypothetical protein
MENNFTVVRLLLLLLLLEDGWNPFRDCMQMRTNVSCVGCLGTVATVLWIKVSGQKIVDYVDNTVNNLNSI